MKGRFGSVPVFARRTDGVGRWWRTGTCLTCGRTGVPVSWTGAQRDAYGSRHEHVHSCADCVFGLTVPPTVPDTPSPPPAALVSDDPPPLPSVLDGPPWVHVAATALSCLSVAMAAVAFLLATG